MTVQGPRPQNIMFLVHEVLECLVAEAFAGVTYDFLVPCPDCLAKDVSRTLTLACHKSLFTLSNTQLADESHETEKYKFTIPAY